MIKRCCDCRHYIPHGVERNCINPYHKSNFKDSSVCALKEACADFADKEEGEDLSDYPKINLRTKRQRIRE